MNQPYPNQQPQFERTPNTPPAHVRYAHQNNRGMLTFEQMDQLVMAINPLYVQQKQRNSYLAHHQARAEMNRIFGYLNWDSVAETMVLGYEEQITSQDDPRWPKERNGNPKTSSSGSYWICGYEGAVRVRVRDLWGMPLAEYREYHFEENAIQPNRGEARSLAMTSVESYALRRALINMGDRFGLGLYNGGSQAPHGQYTQQLFDGQLFRLTDPSNPQQQVPTQAPNVTHTTIVAEPAVGDDVLPSWTPDQQQEQPQQQPQQPPQQQGYAMPPAQQQPQQPPQQQVPQQQQPQQPPQQQVPQQQPTPQGNGTMEGFHQAQQQLQDQRQQARAAANQQAFQPQFDPAMLALAQGAFKVDQTPEGQ